MVMLLIVHSGGKVFIHLFFISWSFTTCLCFGEAKCWFILSIFFLKTIYLSLVFKSTVIPNKIQLLHLNASLPIVEESISYTMK